MKNKNVLRTLKKVITLDKAAQYLSHSLDSKITVTEDDILRYAFEGSITLSVELVKPMFAKMGRLVSRKEVEIHYTEVERLKEMPHELILSVLGGEYYYKGIAFPDNAQLITEEKVSRIEGVWDISLHGSGKEALRQCRKLPHSDDDICMSPPLIPSLKGLVLYRKENGETVYAQPQYNSMLYEKIFLDKALDPRAFRPINMFSKNYCPVVRTDELNRFIKSDGDEETAPKTRNVLLRLILALSEHIYERPIKLPHKASPLILGELTSKDIKLPKKRKFGDYLADAIKLRG